MAQINGSGPTGNVLTTRELTAHCNVTLDADCDLLTQKLTAAVAHTESLCGEFPLPIPAALRQAVMMLAAHFYENREPSIYGTGTISVPFGYDDLIMPYRTWAF